jgi:hypothetical protein
MRGCAKGVALKAKDLPTETPSRQAQTKDTKKPATKRLRVNMREANPGNLRGRLDLLNQAGLDGLDRDEHALGAAIGELHADALEVWLEGAGSLLGDVSTDTTTLLGLTLTMNDGTFGGAFASDSADARHGDAWVELKG